MVFHNSKNVCRSRRAQFLWDISAFYAVCPLRLKLCPSKNISRRPRAYDFQMVCIDQLLFRELRARNDGAVLLDSHTLRVVTQLSFSSARTVPSLEQRVRYRLLSCKYPLFLKKKCSGLTMR